MDHAYWGAQFGRDEIAGLLSDQADSISHAGCTIEKISDEGELCRRTAAAIADGKVVGWFQGRRAAWAFTRSGDTWTQQGNKLVGLGVGRGYQGFSVSLSGDGNTAIVGGPTDDNIHGAAWIYVRRSDAW